MMRILFALALVMSGVDALRIPPSGGPKGAGSRSSGSPNLGSSSFSGQPTDSKSYAAASTASGNAAQPSENYGLNEDISEDWLDSYVVQSEVSRSPYTRGSLHS